MESSITVKRMPRRERRQKPISVGTDDRNLLDRLKQDYEKAEQTELDWGEFLTSIALLGLAVAGVYALAQSVNRSQQSVTACCPFCNQNFGVAWPSGSPPAVSIPCPNPKCQRQLVVSLVVPPSRGLGDH